MRFNLPRIIAVLLLFWLVVNVTACSTAWTSEAVNIINLLVPSITSILGILAAFGLGLSPQAVTDVQNWANQATAGLQTVASLIDQYNAAEATAQPGLLVEIQTALSTITSNLSTLLPEIHVTDPGTQAKILAVVEAVQAEMTALINLVPAIKNAQASGASPADQLKAIVNDPAFAALKSAKDYKKDFNSKAGVFGKAYELP